MNNDIDDTIAAIRATADQICAGAKETAHVCWNIYEALTDEGFTPEQAIRIVIATLTQNPDAQ